MAISNFIPTVWSETLLESLEKQYVAVKNCNRDFDGDIKEMGSKVKICGVGNINIFDYTKDTDMSSMQTLTDTAVELEINRARAFNFQIDDINRAQCTPKLMKAAMHNAASSLANDSDSYVFGLYTAVEEEQTVTNDDTTAVNVIDSIIAAREKLYEGNVGDSEEIVIEVSPQIASLILKAKVTLSNDTNDSALGGGVLGTIAGCRIYVSNNVKTATSGGVTYHKCFVRTKRAIAFADQLSEINAYRPETRFADAVKGLHLYGAKIIYPEELVLLNLGIA
ncbi:MAG: P22 coat protein - protein 5 domain protein, partial [Clostridia bacterium]|nr:P22 coat protein - protein 5 domain protein [Clostridia bacterium]